MKADWKRFWRKTTDKWIDSLRDIRLGISWVKWTSQRNTVSQSLSISRLAPGKALTTITHVSIRNWPRWRQVVDVKREREWVDTPNPVFLKKTIICWDWEVMYTGKCLRRTRQSVYDLVASNRRNDSTRSYTDPTHKVRSFFLTTTWGRAGYKDYESCAAGTRAKGLLQPSYSLQTSIQ